MSKTSFYSKSWAKFQLMDPVLFFMPKTLLLFLAFFVLLNTAQVKMALSNEPLNTVDLGGNIRSVDHRLVNWLKSNISPETGLPYSFYIPDDQKYEVYSQMGESDEIGAVIERMIVEEGLVIYDGAVNQIIMAMLGSEEDLQMAYKPVEVYWEGKLGKLDNIRAGFPVNLFIYSEERPKAVSSNLADKGKRGFIFRIINANGRYNTADPLDGKTEMEDFPTWPTVHWEDWKPIAGENAWVVMAALHLYHKKYFDPYSGTYNDVPEYIELKLAEEIARAALMLQTETGGIRMAPLGTYRENSPGGSGQAVAGSRSWWYHQISTENNISWYAAFRMLYQITGKEEYRQAKEKIEQYMQLVYQEGSYSFCQGMHYEGGEWNLNEEYFALDVQTWAIAAFGPAKIDQWFGDGASFGILQSALDNSGVRNKDGRLMGVGFTKEHDRISVEWSAGAILAVNEAARYYEPIDQEKARSLQEYAGQMRAGIESLRTDISESHSAYSYSSKRGWIPFGWNSHNPQVLSLASTGWVIFVDAHLNPFYLDRSLHRMVKNEP